MLTDVFAAEPDALPGYRKAGFPDPHQFGFPTVRARGLDPVALAILDVLLSKATIEDALDSALLTPAEKPDLYQAPVVTTLSHRTVSLLPAVPADRLSWLAEDWTRYPELSVLASEPAREWLSQVQELCRSTVPTGSLIFVWNCL
ncbi:MAG: hypothetical protein JOY90_28780 [Bradyrhizobium sp.]|uniref:hypothetical protein n=1 Tax=Bradyrhizobium sp. TaxID=376 RepID=UPI001D55CCF0|nr:hypothetical protein [Bradyrhizobium sp.]MBV9564404.1 hypothetical protein [Bradyrhizobium sp.]